MNGTQLIDGLRLSGTGAAKLQILRDYLDTHPKASAEELLAWLRKCSTMKQDEAGRWVPDLDAHGTNHHKYLVTCAKAQEIINGTMPASEMDGDKLIVTGALGVGSRVGPERRKLLVDMGQPVPAEPPGNTAVSVPSQAEMDTAVSSAGQAPTADEERIVTREQLEHGEFDGPDGTNYTQLWELVRKLPDEKLLIRRRVSTPESKPPSPLPAEPMPPPETDVTQSPSPAETPGDEPPEAPPADLPPSGGKHGHKGRGKKADELD